MFIAQSSTQIALRRSAMSVEEKNLMWISGTTSKKISRRPATWHSYGARLW